ncbi:hypothetical protein LMG22037_04709 [Paraburkholderia phenoliruptrix]|uniref:Uncharacterized protein n=1 Tax=Paraburkholderia phenoliruptrix TaxID=252970 RepID=A0A6J5BXI0_9BURK|nr:hypothetical protein [Paraburkholderia phenoliruptrix]CAB3720306.1 hypothetical protein LMG22037_04709 [Paraburkholderia phenoliruptrix]
MPAAWIGAGAAVLGAVGSMSNSPSTSGGGPSYYIPTGLSDADTTWQNILTGERNNAGSVYNGDLLPYYQNSLNLGSNAWNTYGPAYQNAANTAGTTYSTIAGDMSTQALQNWGTQKDLLGAGQQVFNLGLDPQSALYGRTVQQLQDQTGATNSMYGLGSSAAGAGAANQVLSNFNIDWQNNQLSRALQGLQGYAGAANTAGSYGQLADSQAALIPQYQLASGQIPYSTAQGIAAVPGQLAGQYASGIEQGPLAAGSSIMSQIIPYMNYGQGAQAVPFQAQAQSAGALGSMITQGVNGIGNAVQNNGGFSNLFSNGTTGSFGGGDFSGAFSSSPYYQGGGNSYGFTLQ